MPSRCDSNQTRSDSQNSHRASALPEWGNFQLLLAWSSAFEGWAAVVAGEHEQGLARIAHAIAEARTMGSDQFLSHVAGVAAEAYLISGNVSAGLESVADGLRVAARTGERFWEPEPLRVRGELLILQDPQCATGEAKQTFRKAIEHARRQGAATKPAA
jgi:predicted ATPase